MTASLTWITAREVELTGKLIPRYNAESDLVDKLSNVRVAIEGPFLHIDPRPQSEPELAAGEEYDIYVLPAASVKRLHLRKTKKSNRIVVRD